MNLTRTLLHLLRFARGVSLTPFKMGAATTERGNGKRGRCFHFLKKGALLFLWGNDDSAKKYSRVALTSSSEAKLENSRLSLFLLCVCVCVCVCVCGGGETNLFSFRYGNMNIKEVCFFL